MSDFINDFAKQVINAGLCSGWKMQGCYDFEVRELENHFDLKLPTVYKDFLKKMGKGAGKFMQGTDMFYRHLFDNREAFEEVLDLEGNPFSLDKNIFVFSSHQGYIFFFFNTVEDRFDPPVYIYQEGNLKIERASEKFSIFLLTLLEEQKTGWNLAGG
jgi:hypothetical protein